jgi:hypothetical protein
MKPTLLIFLYPNVMRLKTDFSFIFSGLRNLDIVGVYFMHYKLVGIN